MINYRVFFLSLFANFVACIAMSQNPWISKSSFFEQRSSVNTFTANGKVYLCGGDAPGNSNNERTDLWEYTPGTDTWLKKASFPGHSRNEAVSFTCNGYGYMGLGAGLLTDSFSDFYKYDPNSDSWSRIKDYPVRSSGAFYFVIDNRIFVGGGISRIEYNSTYLNSFYELDVANNTWIKRADIPKTIYSGISFNLNGKGFAGIGHQAIPGHNSGLSRNMFEYDPSSNTWTQLQDFPGSARVRAIGISSSSNGFILGGQDLNTAFSDVWKFDPLSFLWNRLRDFPGGGRTDPSGAFINDVGYYGLGDGFTYYDANHYNDWWQFNPDCDFYPQIIGSGLVCPTTNYTISNLPTNAVVTWSSSNPSGISINATSGMASVVGSFNGSVTISAIINNGNCVVTLTKSISVGHPPSVTGYYNNGQPMAYTPYPDGGTINYNSVCTQTNTSTSMTISGAASGTWQLISANPTYGLTWSQSGNNITIYFAGSNETARLRFTVLNTCGSVSNDYYFQSTNCGGTGGGGGSGGCYLYAVSPNPSGSTMKIVVPDSPMPCGATTTMSTDQFQQAEKIPSIQSISIYDASDGQLKLSQQFSTSTKTVNLDVTGLRKGAYILNVSDGNYHEVHRIVID